MYEYAEVAHAAYRQSKDKAESKIPPEVDAEGKPQRPGSQVCHRQQHSDGYGIEKRPTQNATRIGIAQMRRREQRRRDRHRPDRPHGFNQALKGIALGT